MLHRAMGFVLHRLTTMASKRPTTEEHVDAIINFIVDNNRS
jgi:hypothetical protein